jgi:hypothetical protein
MGMSERDIAHSGDIFEGFWEFVISEDFGEPAPVVMIDFHEDDLDSIER